MQHISVIELKKRLDAGERPHVLDVREQEEYDEANMGGHLWPLSKLRHMELDPLIENWKEEEVIVHCKSGKRSLEACMLLETLGFAHTTNLMGGIMEWQASFGEEKIEK